MKNIELFNQATAEILSGLYSQFPNPISFNAMKMSGCQEINDYGHPVDKLGNESKTFTTINNTIKWLADEGYIKGEKDGYGISFTTLTQKGLDAMNKIPEALNTKQSLGVRLQKFIAAGAKELTSETIKQILT